MKVVAISAWKNSGKDTAADYLVKNQGFVRVAFADPLKDMVASNYNIPRSSLDDPKVKESALEQYPVLPLDPYALNVSKLMYREFRTIDGHRPSEFFIDRSGAFLGLLESDTPVQLYWTPRALAILEGSIKRTVTSQYWVQAAINKIQEQKRINDSGILMSKEGRSKIPSNFVISDLRYVSEVNQLRQVFGKDLVAVRINRFDSVQSDDASERNLDNHKFDVYIDNKGSLEDLYKQLEELTK